MFFHICFSHAKQEVYLCLNYSMLHQVKIWSSANILFIFTQGPVVNFNLLKLKKLSIGHFWSSNMSLKQYELQQWEHFRQEHFRQGTLQTGTLDREHFRQGTLQTWNTSDREHFRQGTLQTGNTSDREHFRQEFFRRIVLQNLHKNTDLKVNYIEVCLCTAL